MKLGVRYCLSLLLMTSGSLYTKVIDLTTEKQLNTLVLASGQKAVVKFSATWCAPCQRMKKPYENASNEEVFKDTIFAAVDIDNSKELARKYKVNSVPTLIYIINGKVVDKDTGSPSNVSQRIKEALNIQALAAPIKKTEKVASKEVITPKKEKVVTQDTPKRKEVTAPQETTEKQTFLKTVQTTLSNAWQRIKNSISGLFPRR